ncbi:hypothetical protein [Candidatus Palauibacter sp.]|uniref:hypothetical protein n=1 Tax=Candidatus Palauibacter sp. TaxID=3101350 RepID=UPI003B014910
MAERLLNVVRGFGSIFDLWPETKDDDLYPYDADTVIRRSWERTGGAIWHAIEEFEDGEEETPPNGFAGDNREKSRRADRPNT